MTPSEYLWIYISVGGFGMILSFIIFNQALFYGYCAIFTTAALKYIFDKKSSPKYY